MQALAAIAATNPVRTARALRKPDTELICVLLCHAGSLLRRPPWSTTPLGAHPKLHQLLQSKEACRSIVTTQKQNTCIISWPAHLLGLLLGGITVLLNRGHQQPDDWASLWIGGRILREGLNDHLYDHNPEDFAAWSGPVWGSFVAETSPWPHPFVQAPVVAQIVGYLSEVISFDTSVMLLTLANSWALVVLCASAYYLWFHRVAPMGWLAVGVLALYCTAAFQGSVFLGQTSPLIYAGAAYAVSAARTRPLSSGIVLGCVALVKLTPFALIIVMFAFRDRLRAAVVAVLSSALLLVASVATLGTEIYGTWRETLSYWAGTFISVPVAQSLPSVLLRNHLVESEALVPVIHEAPSYVVWAPRVLAAVLLLGLVAAMIKQRRIRYELAVTVVLCTATATTGLVWLHYIIVIALPIAGLLWLRQRWVIAVIFVFLLPPLAPLDLPGTHLPAMMAGSGLLALVLATAALLGVALMKKEVTR